MNIKDKIDNMKMKLLIRLFKILTKKKNRDYSIKWIQLKTNLINKEEFDEWVTRQVMN